jgi:hypothetical protein
MFELELRQQEIERLRLHNQELFTAHADDEEKVRQLQVYAHKIQDLKDDVDRQRSVIK